MAENERIVVITAAMLDGTGLTKVAEAYPKRVFDVGICEQHAVTLAAGLAAEGFVPVVAIYSTFLQRAYDQIVHDVCLQNLPVVFAVDRAGIVGDDGKTHQGSFDISFLRSIPDLIVAAPRDENDFQHLLATAVRAGRPMALRYPRGAGEGVKPEAELRCLPIGRGEVLRKGRDAAIIAIGVTVYPALAAAEALAEQGIECAVMDARFAKPLDAELIEELAAETGRLLTVEENTLAGGFGSAVLELAAEKGLDVHVACLGLPDRFIEHGTQDLLRSLLSLDAEGIADRLKGAFPELLAPTRR
jgi:1-deoxy-D-xylulose-5-phosphate synthase